MTLTQMAKTLGISKSALSRHVRKGLFTGTYSWDAKTRTYNFDPSLAAAAYQRYISVAKKAGGSANARRFEESDPEHDARQAAELEFAEIRLKLLEIDRDLKAGSLVDKAATTRGVKRLAVQFRDALENIPFKVGGRVASMTNPDDITRLLLRETRAAVRIIEDATPDSLLQ